MNSIEERLRAAANAAGETVAPDSAPPLRLPRSPGWRLRGPGRRARAAWPRTLVPLAAAAAVTAVVAASLAVTGGLSGGRPASSGAQTSEPGTGRSHPGAHEAPQVLSAADRAALASVPRFYVALNPGAMGDNDRAQVRATATGAILATVSAPAPYNTWSWVTAAADDRTFVLAAQEWTPIPPGNAGTAIENKDDVTPTKFFVLHLSSDGRTARLGALPIPVQPGSVWADQPLAPGGPPGASGIRDRLSYGHAERGHDRAATSGRDGGGLRAVPDRRGTYRAVGIGGPRPGDGGPGQGRRAHRRGNRR
jgi:hypothetical protein